MSPEMFKLVMSFLSAIENRRPMDASVFAPYLSKTASQDNAANFFNNYQ